MSDDSVCLATAKEEVAKLQQFSRTLLPGSWVHVKVVEILKSLNDRIKEIERSSTDSSSIQLKVKVPNQSSNLIMSRLALELTLGQLKNLIQVCGSVLFKAEATFFISFSFLNYSS